MIAYKRGLITAAECWYTVAPPPRSADLVHYFQLEQPLESGRNQPFRTIWIRLDRSEEELFKGMNKTTRNEIRRAGQDGLGYNFWHADAECQLEAFLVFFDRHTTRSGALAEAQRWCRLHARRGTLDLSRIDAGGDVLAWHAYYRDGQHARLKYSAAQDGSGDRTPRAVIGRANRFLHWADIRRFKSEGLSIYDFGGWYPGNHDQKLLGVNQFKEGFGGDLVSAFHCTRALTQAGRLFLWAADLKKRLRRTKECAPPHTN